MKIKLLMILLIGVCLLAPLCSSAANPEVNSTINKIDDTVYKGKLILAGKNINLDQPIEGDIFILAQSVSIKNKINGNLSILAQDVYLDAKVTGTTTIAGINVSLNGELNDSGFIAAVQLIEQAKANDLFIAALGAEIKNKANNLWIITNQAQLNNLAANQINLLAPVAVISNKSKINSIKQSGNIAPVIDESSKVSKTEFSKRPYAYFWKYHGAIAYVAKFLSYFCWIVILSIILWLFANNWLKKSTQILTSKLFSNLVWGIGAIIFLSLLIFLAASTLVGIQFSLLIIIIFTLVGHLGFAILAYALGKRLLELILKEQQDKFTSVLAGSIIVAGLMIIPYFGNIFILVTILLGIGAFTKTIWQTRKIKNHV